MSITVTSNTETGDLIITKPGDSTKTESKQEVKPASTVKAEDETEENSEALENESDEVEGDVAEESEDETEDDEEKVKDDERKPKKGFKNRIQKLRHKLSAKEQEANYWKEQALKGSAQPKESQKDAGKESGQATKENSEVNQEPDPSDFETNAEYIRALNKYHRELDKAEAKKEFEASRQREADEKITKDYNSKLDQFKKAKPDFDDVVADFKDTYGDFYASPKIMEALMTSDYGPQVIYEVLKDHKEYERLTTLSEAAIIREIGKIEARIEKSSESSQSEIKKQTKAPPPVKPVGSSKSPVKKSIYDPDISFAEYEQLRREQMRNRAR